MAIISSGQLALQDAGTNASGASYYLETNMSSGSTALTIRVGTRTIENSDVFYGFDSTLSGTIYGYKTSQTSNSGTGRIGRGFDDTNFSVTYSGGVQGSGFLGDPDWFDINGPEFGGSGESWFPSRNVSGVHLGSDSAALGSITTDSFTGGDGNTYEIHHIGWFNNASNTYPNGSVLDTQAEGNWLMFTLKGTSTNPPNTDDSFYSIEINGQEYLRSDVTETTTTNSSASVDSNGAGYYREWLWAAGQISDSELTSIGTTGSRTFKVKSAASVTLNNGVAEEFGGADSSDVKLSDYYKTPGAGAFAHNTTGIPTSGEIKFSDFLAKTRVDIITAVGDDDQSIYGWRGAKVENVASFTKTFKQSETIRLEQNYRSTNIILSAANALIENNSDRLGKNLWTEQLEGENIILYQAYNEQDEARFVADILREWMNKGELYEDAAILYRSNAQSRALEEALLRSSIPYRIYGGQRFYERLEIKNAISYLKIIFNHSDNPSFERSISNPTRGVGEKTLSKIRSAAKKYNISYIKASAKLIDEGVISGKGGSGLRSY